MKFPETYKRLTLNKFVEDKYSIIPLRYEDRIPIMKWRNEQIFHLRQARLLTLEDQNEYFENVVAKLFDENKPSQILVSFMENDVCIGYGGLVHINWIDRNAEISFIMDTQLEKDYFKKHWSTYLRLIEQMAFTDLKLHKLTTYAFDLRPHLYPIIESQGFYKEAILKEHCCIENKFIDVIIHSKIHNSIILRKANIHDIEKTYKWAINKNVRRFSFNKKVILKETHKEWFQFKIGDSNCFYYIAEFNDQCIGSIRFDLVDGDFIISYLVEPKFQGKGLGFKILEKGISEIRQSKVHFDKIKALVILENIASVRTFEKLGFKRCIEDNHIKFEI